MLKKIMIFLCVLALMPVNMDAQLAVGGWTLHTPYRNVDRMAETEVYLYYMSQGALFRVDKETSEVQSLNISTMLNDGEVTGLYAARDGKSMLITYATGNMDRIYDNGKVTNLSDIKDAVMTTSRTINHIDFGEDYFFVGADFGLVVFDSKKNEVRRTVDTPSPVKFVVSVGDYVGISMGNKIQFAKNDNTLTSADVMKPLDGDNGGYAWTNMKGVGDRWIYFINFYSNTYHLHKGEIDFAANTISIRELRENGTSVNGKNFVNEIDVCKNGVYACNDKGAYTISHAGEETFMPGVVKTSAKKMSYFDNAARAWEADASGVHYVEVNSGNIITNTAKPSELTVGVPTNMHIGASGNVYVYNIGEHITWGISSENRKQTFVNIISQGGKITDVTPVDVETDNGSSRSYTPTEPHHVAYGFRLFEDPADPGAFYIGTLFEGCYRVKDGKQTHKYYTDNLDITSFANGWGYPIAQPLVDRNGNLWLYQFADQSAHTAKRIHYLPASKRLNTNVSKADWTSYAVPNMIDDLRDCFGIACKQSDNVIFFPGRWSTNMVLVNSKGTESAADDKVITVSSYVDQDSKSLSFYHILCAVEDNRGRIWIGTDNGVFEITDISKVTSSTATVNHLKVPRNDGTNLADYLLDTQMVNAISVDNSNRKWIATQSGVYLVSENGDEILEHYTTDNSILPSNMVYSVACDPNSSSVFFGTEQGVVEYNSTSSPGQDNYDDVIAYPNPVRPEYTGWITIKGLMNDSLVKIADASGNVFHQGRSTGGMYVWDGCNSAGERVKTGVYYVFASQNASGSSEACVTKIMVVN